MLKPCNVCKIQKVFIITFIKSFRKKLIKQLKLFFEIALKHCEKMLKKCINFEIRVHILYYDKHAAIRLGHNFSSVFKKNNFPLPSSIYVAYYLYLIKL